MTAQSIPALFAKASEVLAGISEWLSANKINLNIAKTNYIIFKLKETDQAFITENNFNLFYNGSKIGRVEITRYLGVLINSKLDWSDHINERVTKLKSYSGILYKYRNHLSDHAAKLIYNSLILSHARYGIELYGASTKSLMSPLEISCNKILRILQKVPRLFHTRKLYEN